MSNLWYRFLTKEDADAAEAEISGLMGCPLDGVNALTGAVDPNAKTLRWAVPQETVDGWLIPVPDDEDHQIDADVVADPILGPPLPPETAAAKTSTPR